MVKLRSIQDYLSQGKSASKILLFWKIIRGENLSHIFLTGITNLFFLRWKIIRWEILCEKIVHRGKNVIEENGFYRKNSHFYLLFGQYFARIIGECFL